MATPPPAPTPSTPAITTYDETPYPSAPFAQTHPDKLSALGRLFGVDAPDPRRARVLELGCADGANLLPMAQHAPESRFLGLDASARQVAVAHAAIAATGLSNVEIRHQNILEFPADSGEFDYVIVHGIFSWVPEVVREKILSICRDHLTPNGIAYISYNAFPGWGMRMALRDMMLFHTRSLADPKAKVQQARALTAFLAESVPTANNPYGLLLKHELDRMKTHDDNYMRHDILEEVNQPFYFNQFMAQAGAAELQYLSETSLDQMLAGNFPAQVAQTLEKVGGDIVAKEQYMDFVRNRNFRQTLLCRRGLTLRRAIMPEMMKPFHFTSTFAKPDRSALNPAHGVPYGFKLRGNDRTVTTDHSLVKAAFDTLADFTLERITFPELLRLAREKSAPFTSPVQSAERAAEEEALLLRNLLQLYSHGAADIFDAPLAVARGVPPQPAATPLARYQALNSRLVTGRAHTPVRLEIVARYVLAACDGTRDLDGVVRSLVEAARAGKLRVAENDKPVEEEARLREVLMVHARTNLASLAAVGFFAAETTGAAAEVGTTITAVGAPAAGGAVTQGDLSAVPAGP
jgi:methyltransferase-like protein/2-polyprenyl-3-methyl-5-hydroxy-6-metoxy-1,4-benzoquinol methylase